MKSPWISALRSVALTVPDLAAAEVFYTQVWQLAIAARTADTVYFRGSGTDHHVLSLKQAAGTPQILKVTLRARTMEALPVIAAATVSAGGTIEKTISPASDPAAGTALIIKDADGRRF